MRRMTRSAAQLFLSACACAGLAATFWLAAPQDSAGAPVGTAPQSSLHAVDQGAPARSQAALAPDATDDDSQLSPHELPPVTFSLGAAPAASLPNPRLVAVARETIRRDRTLVSQCLRLQI